MLRRLGKSVSRKLVSVNYCDTKGGCPVEQKVDIIFNISKL